MKNLSIVCYFLALGVAQSACKEAPKFKQLPDGPIKHQLIVAAKTTTGIRARGFAGATPKNTEVFFDAGSKNGKDISGEDGSFSIDLPEADLAAEFGEFVFSLPQHKKPILYKLKNVSNALSLVAKAALDTPPEVDHVSVDNSEALILSSQAALLRRIEITPDWTLGQLRNEAILLNPQTQSSLSPRMVDSRAQHAMVPMFGSHELALIDLPNNKLAQASKLSDPLAHSAERVMALNDTTYVASFVNYDSATNSYGPGFVALLRLANNAITTEKSIKLPFKNPQFFRAKNATELWISCTGAYSNKAGDLSAEDAGLIKLNISDFTMHSIPFTNFTPAEFELVGDQLVIPELWGNRLAVIREDASELKRENIKHPNYHRPFNFTLAAHWHQNVVFLGDATGTLVAYGLKKDPSSQEDEGFFPFPFGEPMVLNKHQDSHIKLAPHQLIFRHKATNANLADNYPSGFNAWVVSQAQSRMIPLDFLEIFGP